VRPVTTVAGLTRSGMCILSGHVLCWPSRIYTSPLPSGWALQSCTLRGFKLGEKFSLRACNLSIRENCACTKTSLRTSF
jgi:hypothetical protein